MIDDDRGALYENIYLNDFQNLNRPIHIWQKESRGSPALEDLSQYDIVIWYTGDAASDHLQPEDITALLDYLDEGGYLFLTGQGLAGEMDAEDPTFLEKYLHCQYIKKHQSNIHEGMTNSPIGNGIKVLTTVTPYQANQILPVDGARAEFKYGFTPDYISALSYAGYHKVVFFAWNYEGISNDHTDNGYAIRDTVLARILDFFPEFRCGDVDDDVLINIIDVVFLINYLYKSGAAPDPLKGADVNRSGDINILDVVHIINHLYKNGLALNCP
jgi:hypothetical protein